jgi:SAM-dependent methyltransferase
MSTPTAIRPVAPASMPPAATAGVVLRCDATQCCLCGHDSAEPCAVGEDFEYRSSADSFLAVRCTSCGLVYLNPRPSASELGRIYPPNYHAFDFSQSRYGIVYRIRRRLEARRALAWCRGLPADARILDVGCGDGFHLRILRDFGRGSWQLEGVEPDARAAAAARAAGLTVHRGTIQEVELPPAHYDLVLLIATIEHVEDPASVLRAVRNLLRPGGRVVMVTDNTETWDFRLFGSRHWGGYHFPRHWNLFSASTLRLLAARSDLEVVAVSTVLSPVNWVYSLHNLLTDWKAPDWLTRRFGLDTPVALSVFTVFDWLHQLRGQGALLKAEFARPGESSAASIPPRG